MLLVVFLHLQFWNSLIYLNHLCFVGINIQHLYLRKDTKLNHSWLYFLVNWFFILPNMSPLLSRNTCIHSCVLYTRDVFIWMSYRGISHPVVVDILPTRTTYRTDMMRVWGRPPHELNILFCRDLYLLLWRFQPFPSANRMSPDLNLCLPSRCGGCLSYLSSGCDGNQVCSSRGMRYGR